MVESGSSSAFGNRLTATGSTLGTPAYMSPEQHKGRGVDARSDQFGFCVTLWELVFGERPFGGDNLAQLYLAVSAGTPREPPAGADVPTWLRKIMERGLAADAERRWASMDELLAALADDPRRRRGFLLGLAAVLGLALAGFGLRNVQLERARTEVLDACAEDARALTRSWDEAAAAQLEAGFLASGQPFAGDSWSRTRAAIDAYAAAWASLREASCVEARLAATRSLDSLAQVEACLDDAASAFAATIEVLGSADARLVAHASELPQKLPRLERCSDAAALAREFADAGGEGGGAGGEAADLRRELQRAAALMIVGDYAGAAAPIDRAVEGAASLANRDLEARAWLARAGLDSSLGEHEAAREGYERAFMIAGQVSADELALRAATALSFVLGYNLDRYDLALQWGRVAEMFVARLGLEASADAGEVHVNLAQVHYDAGNLDAAYEHGEKALVLFEAELGPEHPTTAGALLELAAIDDVRDESARALERGERALAIFEAAYGPNHPSVAGMLVNVGSFLEGVGRLEDARAAYERSLAIREDAFGLDSVLVARTLTALAYLDYAEGDVEEALALLQRTLAIREAALAPDHPLVASTLTRIAIMQSGLGDSAAALATSARALALFEDRHGSEHLEFAAALNNHGNYLRELGRLDEAQATLERARAIFEAELGPEHSEVGRSIAAIGMVIEDRGEPEEALEHYGRSLAILEAAHGPEHYELCVPLSLMGHAQRALGDNAAARDSLERTLAIDLAAVGPNLRAVDTRAELVDVYEDLGDRSAARRHAEAARDELRSLDAEASEIETFEAWLAAHAG